MRIRILFLLLISLSWVQIAHTMENKGEARIGIIGAGPSGIMAALALKSKGYENVVVLEASDVIGGKVKTVVHNGLPYELGAVITAPDYDLILGMADDLGLELVGTPESVCCSLKGELCSMHEWSKEKFGWLRYGKLALDHAKFSKYVWLHQDFFEPGFRNTPTEMRQNFEPFMQEQGMEAVLEAHRPIMVGCGYGYAEDMPAPYWMKLMPTFAYEYPRHMLSGKPFFTSFSAGWQTLWQKAVEQKNVDVRLSTKVVRVTRSDWERPTLIKVETTAGEFEFDKIIVSVPHLAHEFMDFDRLEQDIFSRVHMLDYKVTLAEIDGLSQKNHLWLRENSYKWARDGQENDGKPVLISSNQNTNVYQIYQFTDRRKNSDELRKIMNSSVREIGGSEPRIIGEVMFQYFPHFDSEAFRQNIPQNLSALQGIMGTFYTGALMDFEIVELAAAHGKHVVDTYF